MFHGLRHDLKFALRQLLKNPGFTAVTIVVIALGIGANAAIFSMVNGVLLRPLPFDDGDELYLLQHFTPSAPADGFAFSVPEVVDYQEQSRSFSDLAEYHSMSFTLLGGGEPQRVQTAVVSANFFEVLGVGALHGRLFEPADDDHGADPVLIFSYAFWQEAFGGDPAVLGQKFEMNEQIQTLVGILPPLPPYPDANQVFIPTVSCPYRSAEGAATTRGYRLVTSVFGRLEPGVSPARAQADVELVAGRLRAEHPEVYEAAGGYDAQIVPLRSELVGEARQRLLILFATAAMVLLLTCANLANLAFARLVRREKELAVRTALGAGRRRLARLLLIESTVLAVLGGALGLFLASGVLDLLRAFAGRFTNRAGDIRIDATVLVFTLLLSILTGLGVGSLPALYSRRNLMGALREGTGRNTSAGALERVRGAMIVAQLAISFILLVSAGLLTRSLRELQHVDAGYDARNVLTAKISLSRNQYPDADSRRQFFTRLLEKVANQPGVVAAAVGETFPLDDADFDGLGFQIEGRPVDEVQARPQAAFQVVSEGYFDAIGVSVVEGRSFRDGDDPAAPSVAVISRAMARRYWSDRSPIGQQILIGRRTTPATIVGVVGDVHFRGLESGATDTIYVPFLQNARREVTFLIRADGDPSQQARPLFAAVRDLDSEQPVADLMTLDQYRRRSLSSPRLTATLLSLFAGLAVVIAAAGVGGLLAYSVSQQTREIGLRMALGAGRRQVVWGILRATLHLLAGGLVLGVAGALFSSRLMSSLLFEIAPNDPMTFLAVGVLLAVVVTIACLVPVRRAVHIDPITALRCE